MLTGSSRHAREPLHGNRPLFAASCQRTDLLKWTSDIVAAYLSRNQMNLKQVPMVMEVVYAKLAVPAALMR